MGSTLGSGCYLADGPSDLSWRPPGNFHPAGLRGVFLLLPPTPLREA
jgi:hypothetical protein